MQTKLNLLNYITITLLFIKAIFISSIYTYESNTNDINNEEEIPICGGFIEVKSTLDSSFTSKIDYSKITVNLFSMDNVLKEHTNVAQSGYYFVPIYDKETVILKVEAPYGMKFEPEQFVLEFKDENNIDSDNKSFNDLCKQDYNFNFVGYKVQGQISTFGSLEGPEGISLTLFSNNKTDKDIRLQDTTTFNNGKFEFINIYPGDYVLKVTNKEDEAMFDNNHKSLSFKVDVNKETYLEKALIVKGYKVSGYIKSNNQPLENTIFLIYSYEESLVANYSCKDFDFLLLKNKKDESKSSILKRLKIENNATPFCGVLSNKEGKFVFSNIPYGKFFVTPYYNNDLMSLEIEPKIKTFDVKHKDNYIEEIFIVKNITLTGKVVNHSNNGIKGVVIIIDGQKKATSDDNGIYVLENISPGNYDLEAQSEDMFFEPITNIELSPFIKSIPNMIVKDYKLCGKIYIEKNEYISVAKRSIVLRVGESQTERRTITDNNGRYCFDVKPDKYNIIPVLTQEEKDMELHINPESILIEVVDKPLLDINFYQSKVEVTGFINCLDKCNEEIVVYLSNTKTDKVIKTDAKKQNKDNKLKFVFENILSGQYNVYLQKYEWCFNNENLPLKVQNTKIDNLEFKQTGYSMFYESTNDTPVLIEKTTDKDTKLDIVLKKLSSKVCLPKEGEYKITPKSCYKFPEKNFYYNTKVIKRLILNPSEFLVKGNISIISKIFKNLNNNVKGINVNVSIEEIKDNSIFNYLSLTSLPISKKDNYFEFYSKPKVDLIITPEIKVNSNANTSKELQTLISKLIFYPKFKQIKIENNCLENSELLNFEMRIGQLIEGQIEPSMEGVIVNAYDKDKQSVIAETTSLKDGRYKIGPIYSEANFEIKAIKEGYKILVSKTSPFNFTAEKLSLLRVNVVDEKQMPLSGVFLSLSCAKNSFKNNSNTNSNGQIDFVDLFSGEYYIKPLLKEYKFEPSQKQVSIIGGEHYNETIVGHRVAFSIYGKISTLDNQKIEGLSVQAYNNENNQIQEAIVDKNMEYRLRGLKPERKYFLKVKIPASSNIEKSLPYVIPIDLQAKDVREVDFIAIKKSKRIDIRGYLDFVDELDNCPEERVKNIQLELTKISDENSEDSNSSEINENQNNYLPKKISLTCQFVYTKLEKSMYNLRIIEKQGKSYNKVLYDNILNLKDYKDIKNGTKTVLVNIKKSKGTLQDHLNYSIFSPAMICIILFVILQWDTSISFYKKIKSFFVRKNNYENYKKSNTFSGHKFKNSKIYKNK